MAIIRYTSPTQEIKVKGVDITSAEKVYVTYRSGSYCHTFEDVNMEFRDNDTYITVELTQQLTARISDKKPYSLQVNWIQDGKRLATRIKTENAYGNLLEEVLP